MQIREGATVVTVDEQDVGRVDRVVIDPRSGDVTHLVVRKGLLLPEDKVVPMAWVATSTEDRVTLREMATALDDLPLFEELHYVSPEDDETAAGYALPLYWYPTVGAAWGGYSGGPPPPLMVPPVETERNIPAGTVPLKEGARVVSADGEEMGEVERIVTDGMRGQVTHFVLGYGLLTHEHKLIPAHWVRRLRENEIELGVSKRTVDRLPVYER